MNLGHVGHRRGAPGADRPYGLVGDDGIDRGGALGQRAVELPRNDLDGPALVTLGLGFADTDDGDQPALWAATAFARTASSVSPWSVRRSECPTMT